MEVGIWKEAIFHGPRCNLTLILIARYMQFYANNRGRAPTTSTLFVKNVHA